MKKIFIFLALLLYFESSFSQVDTVNTLEEHQAMFSEIDKSKITTGILYDRVLPFSGIERFTGKKEGAICTKSKWKQIYHELQNARYDKDTANVHDLDFIFGRKIMFTNGKLIPIYLLNYKYDKIKDNALDDDLILMQNNKIVENPAKTESPFVQKRVFVASSYKSHTYYGNNFAFIFNDNFLYTNTNEIIAEIYADFDDGFGENKIALGKKLFVSYTEIVNKTIKIKAITQNNDTLYTKFAFEVKAKSIPNYTITRFETDDVIDTRIFCPCIKEYVKTYAACWAHGCNIDIENVCKKGGSLYHFKSQVTPNSIDKTLLIVEGFDMNDDMFAEELYEVFNKQKLANVLLANNYDIFIVNYDVPTDDITNNAIYVENVIDHINDLKDNKTELIIAGGSMGGLVTRYAITSMEQSGKDTQTRLWISFDSPQKGANIPLGVQYFMKEVNSSLSLAGDLIEKLRAPAAKQMLIYHFDDYPNMASERTSFVTNLDDKGFPQTSRNIAITNGASNGTGQGYSNGSEILKMNWQYFWQTKTRYLTAWALPNGGSNFTIFKKIKKRKKTVVLVDKKVSNTHPLDAAPGGFRNTMEEIDDEMSGLFHITSPQSKHAFIPAVSALGLNADELDDGYYCDFRNDHNLLQKTFFDMLYFPNLDENKSKNQEHVWLSHETAENIMTELYPENVTLGNTNPDWTQGEIHATNSIHIANGFHASANDQLHVHIVAKPSGLIPENWVASKETKHVKRNKSLSEDINIANNEDITIYPNPTYGKFTILNSENNIQNAMVTNITGKIVYLNNNIDKTKIQIDISKEKHGIYILKIQTEKNIITHKIIKQ